MRRPALALFVLAIACTPTRPLPEAILGEWEDLCRTDKEATATCPGREKRDNFKRFLPGGKLASTSGSVVVTRSHPPGMSTKNSHPSSQAGEAPRKLTSGASPIQPRR